MRFFPGLLLCLFASACASGPRPAAPIKLAALKDPTSLPALRCGRTGQKPVQVSIDVLPGNHLAITLNYHSLNEQFRYVIEEVRPRARGPKALGGHRLANADGKDATVDPSGSFVFYSGTPPRADELNSTFQYADSASQLQVDLETGETASSGRRAQNVYLRCENLDAFIDALSAG